MRLARPRRGTVVLSQPELAKMRYRRPNYTRISGLGGVCPPCHVPFGTECVPCPEGATLAECTSCVNGEPVEQKSWWEKSGFLGPVLTQIVAMIAVTVVVSTIMAPDPKHRRRQ